MGGRQRERGGERQRERERERERETDRQRDRDRERSLDSEHKKSVRVLKIFHWHPDGPPSGLGLSHRILIERAPAVAVLLISRSLVQAYIWVWKT